MAAFDDLSTDRAVTMGGLGPVPRASVSDYIRSEGIIHAYAFRRLIKALDNVYLRAVRERVNG
jgi:hypothetical protein